MRRTGTSLVVALAVLGTALSPMGRAQAVDASCESEPVFSQPIEELPWAQRMYDPPNKLWPYSRGAGVTVAVLDSGVDPSHFQFQFPGKVLTGTGYVPDAPPRGDIDCTPFGTAVASIIAAQPVDNIGFFGLAPDATILPVRVSDKIHTNPDDEPLSAAVLAQGIDYAVANGGDVIAVSAVSYDPDPVLQAAVSRAVLAGVVVVAGVGDGHNESRDGLRPTQGPAPYPASNDGVIGVGSVGSDGERSPTSQIGLYVDLVAPGVDVTAAAFGGHESYNGTGIAVGFVAAAAALMLGQQGTDLANFSGAQRVNVLTGRLLGTADGTVGEPSTAYGSGQVNTYRAMSEAPGGVPVPLDDPRPPPPDREALALAAERAAANDSSTRDALLLGGLALVVLSLAFTLPRARRRRWLPGRERETLRGNEDKRPEYLPGELLFRPSTGPGKDDKVSQNG